MLIQEKIDQIKSKIDNLDRAYTLTAMDDICCLLRHIDFLQDELKFWKEDADKKHDEQVLTQWNKVRNCE